MRTGKLRPQSKVLDHWQLLHEYEVTGSAITSYAITSPYNVLMISGEGADASTTVIDECGHAVTCNGGAQIDTAQFKFGQSSILFDGTGDYLSLADSADWTFGANDFTIDLWVRFNSLTNRQGFVGQDDLGGTHFAYFEKISNANGNKLQIFSYYGAAYTAHYTMTNNWSVNVNQWYHIAFVRSGSNAFIFIDGVSQALTTTVAFTNLEDISGFLYIGNCNSNYLDGWLDDIRISKGIARWTSAFTPPLKTTALINGDTDEEYKLVTELSGIGSDSLYSMRFNSDSGSNYGYQRIYGGSTTIGASRGTGNTIYLSQSYVGSGEVCLNETLLYAKSGYVRTMLIQDESSVNGTTVEYMYNTGYSWNNTTAPVASVNLSSDISNGINIGSKIILYRKVT